MKERSSGRVVTSYLALLSVFALFIGLADRYLGVPSVASAGPDELKAESTPSSSVLLGSGHVLDADWSIYIRRAKIDGNNPNDVCLTEFLRFSDGVRSRGGACGRLSPPANSPVFTLSSLSVNRRDATVIGAAFRSNAYKVLFDLADSADRVKLPKLLNARQAQKARLPKLRYTTFDIAKDVCVQGFTVYSRAGAVLLDTQKHRCGGPVVEETSVGSG